MQTFARDFPELISVVCEHLQPVDVAALACVCREMCACLVRTCAPPLTHWRRHRAAMRELSAIKYSDPRKMWLYGVVRGDKPQPSNSESVSHRRWRGRDTIYTLFTRDGDRIFVCHTGENARVYSYTVYTNGGLRDNFKVSICDNKSGISDSISAQHTWAFGCVSLGWVMHETRFAWGICAYLSMRDMRALACASYALHKRLKQLIAFRKRDERSLRS